VVATSANAQTNTTTTTTKVGDTIATPVWTAWNDPKKPAWYNDRLDLLVRPQFGIWDLASCSSGVAAAGNSTACTTAGATVLAKTGVTPVSYQGSADVTVADLLPCVNGLSTYIFGSGTNEVVLDQPDCAHIVSQDPFAATALGLVPTPVGQFPGQAVNPASLLGGSTETEPTKQLGPNESWNFEHTQTDTVTNSYNASSSSESAITNIYANSTAIGATIGVNIGEFSASGNATITYGSTNTFGWSQVVNYSGTQTVSNGHGFHTIAAPR